MRHEIDFEEPRFGVVPVCKCPYGHFAPHGWFPRDSTSHRPLWCEGAVDRRRTDRHQRLADRLVEMEMPVALEGGDEGGKERLEALPADAV
jgi:hypothetical protein